MAIAIIDGFELRAKKHLDGRQFFETKNEMDAYDPNSLAEGLLSYCAEDQKTYQWDGQQWTEFAGAGGGGGGTWTSSDPTIVAVGGLKQGTNLNGKTTLEIIDMMVNPYQAPIINISINPSTTLYEIGTQATVTVTANLTKKTNAITEAKILKDGTSLKEASVDEITAKTFSQAAVTFNNKVVFSSKVSDAQGEVSGNSITVNFTRRSYYGTIAADASVTTDTEIEALSKNQLTGSKGLTWNSLTSNNQKLVYAYPASFGDLTSIKDANNFENLTSFAKNTVQRDGVTYNVYTLITAMSITNGKLTFS